ncbi:MAG: lipopolysaccharide/colanic/teichoic acid biosynthesis glycosyltransferase [Polaribacter sp.]|jgi:lipopolysaccharide/colanic/teichoic acid biosynthesis glycosyltransferase|tara:strand:+ start:98 stop:703 length:606 start_codon:yes stop_codon:yes gene_type:complete
MYKFFFKRFFDVAIALIALVLFSPVFFLVFLLLLSSNQGNPFFFQKRPGLKGKIFKVIKFKTMNEKRDAHGSLLPDAKRLTKLGIFLRKTSFDEGPQVLNILKGDMSIIGPRPLLPEYLPLYNKTQKKRHDVKPGITGWAQINGRNAISWKKKFEYDVWYVENRSFLLDVKIFFKTFLKVVKSEGVNKEGEVTTTKFKGSK